jgi:tetratricopeptide (TPR) repeat protein
VQAPNPYAKAVITAAADARRRGAWSALSRGFFEVAVIGYLTPAQRAVAPADWLDTALAYALIPVHGAATTLTPVPADDRTLGAIAGYVVADYLLEYARRARRTTPVPDACWEALLEHTHDQAALRRLAAANMKRMRPDRAEQFYRRLAAEGDEHGAMTLAGLLRKQGRTDEEVALLKRLAAANPDLGTRWLANALLAAKRIDEAIALLAPPNEGTWHYAQDYVKAMTANHRRDEAIAVLRARAVQHVDAVHELADYLAEQGATDELWALFRRYPQFGYLAWEVGGIRLKAGKIDEGLDAIRAIADSDALDAAETFARLLMEHGRIDELRGRAHGGDRWSVQQLADWLSDNGHADELADLVNRYRDGSLLEHLLSDRLAEALFAQGNVEGLRARADAGCQSARCHWAELMIEQGRIEEVRARADAGGRPEAIRLAQMYEDTGSFPQAIEVLRGHPDLRRQLAKLLAKADRLDEAIDVIRPLATQGDPDDLFILRELLVQAGREDELRSRGEAGDLAAYAALAYSFERAGRIDEAIEVLTARFALEQGENRGFHLAELLQREGRLDELRALADQGSWHAQRHLAAELAADGALDELLSRARVGDGGLYRFPLVDLLAAQNRLDELREFAVRGDQNATRHFLQILARQGRVAELREEVEAGTDGAAQTLKKLLRRQPGK